MNLRGTELCLMCRRRVVSHPFNIGGVQGRRTELKAVLITGPFTLLYNLLYSFSCGLTLEPFDGLDRL